MLTLAELRVSQINPRIAEVAYEHAAKRLDDVLETKKSFEDKALALMGAYITVSLASFGAVGLYLKEPDMKSFCVSFSIAGAMFAVGAVAFLMAIPAKQYGARASAPEMWLVPGILDGEDDILPYMMSCIARFHHDRIKLSQRANEEKASFLRAGILIGIFAPFIALLVLLLSSVFFS